MTPAAFWLGRLARALGLIELGAGQDLGDRINSRTLLGTITALTIAPRIGCHLTEMLQTAASSLQESEKTSHSPRRLVSVTVVQNGPRP